MPNLIDALDGELHRLNFRNVINIVNTFHQIYDAQKKNPVKIMKEAHLADVHRMQNRYLQEYLSQSKKEITGSDFTNMMESLMVA